MSADREMLLRYLAMAKDHADTSQRHIDLQKRLITDLVKIGSDTTATMTLLDVFERSQAVHIRHIDQLLDELDQMPATNAAI